MTQPLTFPELVALPEDTQEREWAYNALDCTGTRRVWDVLRPRLSGARELTYSFHRALQAPVMAMMRRGVLVDQAARKLAIAGLERELELTIRDVNALPELRVWDALEKITGFCKKAGFGKRHKWQKGVADCPERVCTVCGQHRMVRALFNPNSTAQCAHLFHALFGWALEKNKKGEVSEDEEVLEKYERKYPKYSALLRLCLRARELKKQLGFLKSRLSSDGRMMSTFNVAAAWTSRFSSSKNPKGLGTNLQNISERHRYIFTADPGMELFYADLERAESLVVANVSGDEAYIAAHKGDTHTLVASLLWPELPWTGDPKADKDVAKALPEWDQAPGHDFRFQAKRIQHGSNFGLTPKGIALIAHIPQFAADTAQGRYFEAFPGIQAWQRKVRQMVEAQVPIVNPFGYTVELMGRPWDGHTWRQALSLVPQSTVAHALNLGLWRAWREWDPELLQALAQVHDAILGQGRASQRDEWSQALVRAMSIPIWVDGFDGKRRLMNIGVEVMVGRNWGKFNDDPKKGRVNLGGLKVIHV